MAEAVSRSVDLTNCDREPIHLLGNIQPFGFLISASRTEWTIEHASRNIKDWLGVTPAEIIGRPVELLLGRELVHDIRGKLQRAIAGGSAERMFNVELGGERYAIAVHLAGASAIIECERARDDRTLDTAAAVRGAMARLHRTDGRPFVLPRRLAADARAYRI